MLSDNVKVIENISKEKQQEIWDNTISGSQIWKLFKSDKDYKLLMLSKLHIFKCIASKFSLNSMKRGIEREPLIIERLKIEYEDYTNIIKNNKTFYNEKYQISANPDAIDEKAKIVFEIKSSASDTTKEYAVYQLSLYKLLLSLYDEKYFDYKYLLVSENPENKKITITEPVLLESKKLLDHVIKFWLKLSNCLHIFSNVEYRANIDENIIELQRWSDIKNNAIENIEKLENKLNKSIGCGNKNFYYRIQETKQVKYKARDSYIQTRNINKLVIGKINYGEKSA